MPPSLTYYMYEVIYDTFLTCGVCVWRATVDVSLCQCWRFFIMISVGLEVVSKLCVSEYKAVEMEIVDK